MRNIVSVRCLGSVAKSYDGHDCREYSTRVLVNRSHLARIRRQVWPLACIRSTPSNGETVLGSERLTVFHADHHGLIPAQSTRLGSAEEAHRSEKLGSIVGCASILPNFAGIIGGCDETFCRRRQTSCHAPPRPTSLRLSDNSHSSRKTGESHALVVSMRILR